MLNITDNEVIVSDADPIQKVHKLNIQDYVAGYRVVKTYQNAPYSCEGGVLTSIVEYYNYTTCFQSSNKSAPSFLRLLNIGK